MKCDWCGKEIHGNSVHDGIFITPHHFCSKKCQAEYHANKNTKSDNIYEDDDKTSILGYVWKMVKWVIIFIVVWFVYDNYIK